MKKIETKTLFFVCLCCVGLFLWTSASFLGLAYVFKGALFNTIVLSLAIFLFMAAFMWGMCKNCDPKRFMGSYSKAMWRHRLCWLGYLVVCALSAVLVNHGLTVTLSVRSDIQNSAKQEIKELGVMFASEETEHSYLEWVKKQKENLEGTLAGVEKDVVELKLAELDEALTSESGFNTLKENAYDSEDGFLGCCYYAVVNWTWWNVADYLDQLEINKRDYIEKVVECSKASERTKNEPYSFVAKFNNENLSAKLTDPKQSSLGGGSIAFIIIVQLLILLYYITIYPWGESKGGTWNTKRYKKDNHEYGHSYEGSSLNDSTNSDNEEDVIIYNPE